MSYLANEIDHLLNEHKKTAADFAKKTGITPAQLSRWRSGEQITIKHESLKQLADGFSNSPKIHARLLFATLKDACLGPGAAYISLQLDTNDHLNEPGVEYKIKLPPAIKDDLNVITGVIQHDRQVRDLIHVIANSSRRVLAFPQALSRKSSKGR